jgi:hypothetical protein
VDQTYKLTVGFSAFNSALGEETYQSHFTLKPKDALRPNSDLFGDPK